jgi:hypothetical protein
LGKSTEKIIEEILLNPSYTYLINSKSADGPTSMDFSSDKKSEVFIREAFSSNAILRCAICNGYLHSNSISIDHIKRKQDGGKGSLENGQVAHFYCNTTFKN